MMAAAFQTRPVNDNEWADRKESFPALTDADRDNFWVLRDAPLTEQREDCVSYTVGENEGGWHHDLPTVIAYYAKRGYVKVAVDDGNALPDNATVDLWIKSNGTFAHASMKFEGPYAHGMPCGLWVSAPVSDQVFTHGREDIYSPEPVGYWHAIGASLKKA
jgi:hypothetical protein